MAIIKEKRLEINKKLPHGWQTEVANMLGLSKGNVCNWVHGRINNRRIEKAVMWILQNHNQREAQKELIVDEFLSTK